MPVPQDLLGPHVQIVHRLRWTKDAPPRQDRVSERPRDPKTGHFRDSDEAPTLVTFEPDDAIDVESLLRAGALRPYVPPRPIRVKPLKEETADGAPTG